MSEIRLSSEKRLRLFAGRGFPELADEVAADEELSKQKGGGHTYFQDTTYKHLLMMAQNDLFKGQDLTDLTPSFNCSCTS